MLWQFRSKKNKMLMIFASVIATILLGLLAVNFTLGEKKVRREIAHLYGINDPQFLRTMGEMLGPNIVAGNRVQALINGGEIFPAMLTAIRSAQKTITFETYIYWSGEVGRQFAQALSERARAGVKVHVLLDWVGSGKLEESQMQTMRDNGVEILKYRPLRWYNLARFNNRTHRKLLVVDGKIGFTGGVGIADKWDGHAQDADHWRDTHFRVEGPVVAQMQAVVLDNWMQTTGKVLHGEEYFPPLQPVGGGLAQMFSSSPSGGSESMALMYLLAITAAQKSIYLSNSYFVPDDLMRGALINAARRGVKVQIITPGAHIDTKVVRRASRGKWGELLQNGVEIFEYQPTMFHCKEIVVDEFMVSVGSTNFDERSFRLNDEANLNVYDAAFAQRQIAVFQQDLQQSRRITLQQWEARPISEKLMERGMAILGPLL
jgi:cardiolipin synthase